MKHPLFDRYPLSTMMTSVGEQPTPYHVYDGQALWLAGTADLAPVQALLAGEALLPATTRSGRALMSLWAVDEPQASHGPHSELQFSIYVTHAAAGPAEPVADGPMAVLDFLMRQPAARQLVHGLWNDTPAVVAYNHEVLGLTPRLATAQFSQSKGRVGFEFHDAAGGELLAKADLKATPRNTMQASMALFRTFGFTEAMRLASLKEIETITVNPLNEALPRNTDAHTYAAPGNIATRLWDAGSSEPDRLEIPHPVYGNLDFQATLVEHMTGFKLVYLNPVR